MASLTKPAGSGDRARCPAGLPQHRAIGVQHHQVAYQRFWLMVVRNWAWVR
jgi:hypothetical protein